jgi:CheY-like chemotaxis protein
VAEDNAINSKVIAAQLLFLGCRADTVGTGREAVEAMDLAPYDLVLMDCQMPDLDGYQAAAEIRTREAGGRRVPIVAVTAHALREDRSRCLAAGMDDYVTKPLTLERLELALNRWLGEAREPGQVAADAGPPESGEPVSLETLARASVGDEALRRELVALFETENAERLNAIERSLEAGDLEAARREAHTMKGVSSTLGAAGLSRLAARFEARMGTDSSEEWTGLLLDLQREHDRVVRYLRENVPSDRAS